MDWGSHGSSKIGRAWSDVAKMIIIGEFGNILEFFKSQHESFKNCSNVSSFLHRDYSKLIFLIDPCQEGFVSIMEDTSVIWPVSVDTTSLKESITLFEKEMICNQLILFCLGHCS